MRRFVHRAVTVDPCPISTRGRLDRARWWGRRPKIGTTRQGVVARQTSTNAKNGREAVNKRPGTWACRGDSGAPVFAGRIFGYSNEAHLIAAIVSESSFATLARCAPNAAEEDDKTVVVSLMHPIVRSWLCDKTDRALEMCK